MSEEKASNPNLCFKTLLEIIQPVVAQWKELRYIAMHYCYCYIAYVITLCIMGKGGSVSSQSWGWELYPLRPKEDCPMRPFHSRFSIHFVFCLVFLAWHAYFYWWVFCFLLIAVVLYFQRCKLYLFYCNSYHISAARSCIKYNVTLIGHVYPIKRTVSSYCGIQKNKYVPISFVLPR